jgi:nicotinamide mononucleotide transporter PnuC
MINLEPLKFLFKSIGPDLKCFKFYEIIILVILLVFMLTFSVIDLDALVNKKGSILRWVNDRDAGYETWKLVFMTLSGLSSFTGILSVVLIGKKKFSCYFWGIINNILFGLFAISYGYVGSAQIYLLYAVPISFIGMYLWFRNMNDNNTLKVSLIKWYHWPIYSILLVTVGIGFYFEIPALSKALFGVYQYENQLAPHILDASLDAFNVIAYIMMLNQKVEQWVFWLVIDGMLFTLYSMPPDVNVLVMTSFYTLNAIYGLIMWIKSYREDNKEKVYLWC